MDYDQEEDDESADEYSDDDDMSWKVRRAAAKCLEAVIATRHELLDEFFVRYDLTYNVTNNIFWSQIFNRIKNFIKILIFFMKTFQFP